MNSLRQAARKLTINVLANNSFYSTVASTATTTTIKSHPTTADTATSSNNITAAATSTTQESQRTKQIINPLNHPDFFGIKELFKMEDLFTYLCSCLFLI
jgi:hypothetical protein